MAAERGKQSDVKSSSSREPPILFVLLGASNLARACHAVEYHLKGRLAPREIEVAVAAGPGRGYHSPGGVLNVVYPPIVSCPILNFAVERAARGYKIIALVTDIGNDLMYGVSAGELIKTLQGIFERLQSAGAEIYITPLPENLERGIGHLRFAFLRSVFYPRSRLSAKKVQEAVVEINRFLKEELPPHGHVITGLDSFFGWSEIHFGWFRAHRAWRIIAQEMLAGTGVKIDREFSFALIMKSLVVYLRKLIGSDLFGFKKPKPNQY